MSKLLPILLFLLLFCGTTTADTLYANETGWYRSGDAFNATGTPIQHAVDNATAGDTVYVWNGTYAENVVISTSITLEGEDNSTTIVRSPSSTSNGITISSDNIILKDICINHCSSCIYLNSVDNCTIRNIITRGDYPTNRSSYDVRMWSSTNMVIDNNRFASVRPVYISSSNNITFTNNILSPTILSYSTAEMLNLNDSVIEGNTFNKGYGGALKITGAINVSVTRNTFPSGYVYLTNFNDSNVVYNTITSSNAGLHLTSSENVNISHNVHDGRVSSSGSSLGIYSSNAITLHNNSITLSDIHYSGAGFKISNSVNITATNTTIDTSDSKIEPFIVISGTTKEQYNHSINTSNTLFGKPIYYYFNNTSISLSDLNTTYLKLVYCNNAVLNNVTSTMYWSYENIVHSDDVQIINSTFAIRLDSSDQADISYHSGSVYIDPVSIGTTITNCGFSTETGKVIFDTSGTSYVTISHCTGDLGAIEYCDHCTISWCTIPYGSIRYVDDLTFSHNEMTEEMCVYHDITNSAFSDNVFNGLILLDNSDITFTSNAFHCFAPTGTWALGLWSAETNIAFIDSTFYGTPDPSMCAASLTGTYVNVTFTDTTFEHAAYAMNAGSTGPVNFIQNNNRVFTGTAGYTIADTSKTNLTGDGTHNYSHFYVTPSAGSVNITDITWGATGRGTKTFNLTATDPTANVSMSLGDWGNSVPIQITIDGIPKEIVHTGTNSILSYTYTDGIAAKTQFKFETYNKTTTNPDAIYEDVNNSINDTGVYEYDTWVTGLTPVTNLSVNTTVATAILHVTDYTANSTGNFTISFGEPSCVVVFNLKTVPAGTYTSFYTNGVKTYIAKATSSNISTYYDIGGFATAATLHTVRVKMGLGTETTATMTVGDTGTRDISTYMPLLTSGMPLGYKVSNVSSIITNVTDAAMINYTVTNSTIVVISEDAGVTPSNLPLVIGGGGAVVITVIVFLRRRRR